MIRIILFTLATTVALGAAALELTDAQRAAIEDRIKPVGESCMHGDSSCAAIAVAGPVGAARSGEEVYNAACMACHSTGAAGAPKVGDVAAWAERINQGMEILHEHGVKGMPGTGMIAKGGCMSCSDDEVIAAVDYMVDSSR